jgi:hypothetical protein
MEGEDLLIGRAAPERTTTTTTTAEVAIETSDVEDETHVEPSRSTRDTDTVVTSPHRQMRSLLKRLRRQDEKKDPREPTITAGSRLVRHRRSETRTPKPGITITQVTGDPRTTRSVTDTEPNPTIALQPDINAPTIPIGETRPVEYTYFDQISSRFYRKKRKYTVINTVAGFFLNNRQFVKHLNRVLRRRIPHVYTQLHSELLFTYATETMRTTIQLPDNTVLRIPDEVSQQLGFGTQRYFGSKLEASQVTDVHLGTQTLYVYSDVIKNVVVGDTHVPLLRTVPVGNHEKGMNFVSFQNIIYHPVKTSSIREISVYLRDRTGNPIPFECGEVSVVLAFRPVRYT